MDDRLTRALDDLLQQSILVRFKPIDLMLSMLPAWPTTDHIVCILTTLSAKTGNWEAILTVRDDALSWLRAHPERQDIVLAALRELVAAHHECALMLTDGEHLSILPMPRPVRVTLPPSPPLLNGNSPSGTSLVVE